MGRLRVHNPPGERKSGMPHSVEMPAPVKGTMVEAAAIMSPSCSTPLRISDAIIGLSEGLTAQIIARSVGLHLRRAGRASAPLSNVYAAFATGSLASSLFFSSLFLDFTTGAAAWDFFAGLPYCDSLFSSDSS